MTSERVPHPAAEPLALPDDRDCGNSAPDNLLAFPWAHVGGDSLVALRSELHRYSDLIDEHGRNPVILAAIGQKLVRECDALLVRLAEEIDRS